MFGDAVETNVDGGTAKAARYRLLPADLRDTEALTAAVKAAGLRRDRQTLVICECVLVYMQPEESARLVRWAGETFDTAGCAVYEQINPGDAFGRQMIQALEARGCPLLGLVATPTCEAHERRFLDAGWDMAEAADMAEVYRRVLDQTAVRAAERLEPLDEVEEWNLFQSHYCVCLAVKDPNGVLATLRLRPVAGTT